MHVLMFSAALAAASTLQSAPADDSEPQRDEEMVKACGFGTSEELLALSGERRRTAVVCFVKEVAAEAMRTMPSEAGPGVIAKSATADGTLLTFTFEIDSNDAESMKKFGRTALVANLTKESCANPALNPLITAGGQIRYRYQDAQGIEAISGTVTQC